MTDPDYKDIPGASDLIDWFGYWPTFHDAEVLRLDLQRKGVSTLRLDVYEIDAASKNKNRYVRSKEVTVTFYFEEIRDLEIEGFSQQNVIASLLINRVRDSYELVLSPCYGLAGKFVANKIYLKIEPKGAA